MAPTSLGVGCGRKVVSVWGNKYSKFSKKERDPLEVAIAKDELAKQGRESKETLRGTTVPVPVPVPECGDATSTATAMPAIDTINPTDAFT